ncbi:hypothetical protein M441DRAFT_62242 [Trichoderma asperellum CBS 433.97]|uniref:Uncharacterized protein n=1 Tax=Trichoderma asperellum (strain ATCC 204424 / CBS 433.97 / NBRC 101777) TaxID=1042311 RepID=A0A2T3YUL1_TRIA4|nr:hypothetical protein M441DRAFT_62242 [Trichoderma asperellum CBS 433.97]PTB36263.1 hypothetical protein M441DRAFT_62242 [Trichoderma asperellum CBS 433.97]
MFNRLETTFFIPTLPWLEQCLANPLVKRYLEKSRYRKPVYIITGLKTVTGAAVKTNNYSASANKVGIEAEIPGSEGILPWTTKPGIATKQQVKDNVSWEDRGDFIFAYRVSKVWIKKGSILEDDYTRGAMFANHVTTAVNPVMNIGLEVEKVEEADPAEEGFLKEEIMDGDERIIIAMPERADCRSA